MVEYHARLKCPWCGYIQDIDMPSETRHYLYECWRCRKVISPLVGSCCIFCSYADKPCPQRQRERDLY